MALRHLLQQEFDPIPVGRKQLTVGTASPSGDGPTDRNAAHQKSLARSSSAQSRTMTSSASLDPP